MYYHLNFIKMLERYGDFSLSEDGGKRKIKIRSNNVGNRKISYKWVITIFVWTFFISSFMQMAQAGMMSKVNLYIAFVILVSIIFIGIIFDIVGVAVTCADEAPFHSMSSRKVRGAKEAIALIRNADKVGNFCNDVIGDIAGIISGSATGAIVLALTMGMSEQVEYLTTILLTGGVAALTVGGKALGKGIAILNCNSIVFTVGKLQSLIRPDKTKNKKDN